MRVLRSIVETATDFVPLGRNTNLVHRRRIRLKAIGDDAARSTIPKSLKCRSNPDTAKNAQTRRLSGGAERIRTVMLLVMRLAAAQHDPSVDRIGKACSQQPRE
jgi:hypothetical protein